MDPDVTLARLRETVGNWQQKGADNLKDPIAEAQEMADLFEALDTWIAKGGFLPAAWKAYR
jgi:hypothetical protein